MESSNRASPADGLPDDYESDHQLDTERDDAHDDLDADGIDNLAEFHFGTLPELADTDGDGLPTQRK